MSGYGKNEDPLSPKTGILVRPSSLSYKKAIVTLAEGEVIDFYSNV